MVLIVRVMLFLCVAAGLVLPAEALRRGERHGSDYDFTNSEKYAGLVVNADTGEIIYQRNANRVLYPASLTKMMTIYVTLKEIEEGNLSFGQKLPISVKAASMPRTNMRLRAGGTITVKEAILGLIVHSANDAAVVLAEAISGSETAFAEMMTDIATKLGMSKTVFKNAHGLHDSEQVTCALDMAKLAIALRRDYPKHYHLFSTKSFRYNGHIINSHNRVMHKYKWADGLKTGFVNASGFNLVTSTNRVDTKLVGVVMGGHTARARDAHMVQLLEHGYETIQTVSLNRTVKPYTEAASVVGNRVDIPYKDGVFEVAFNDDGGEVETLEEGEILGNLVDKGLGANSKLEKLDIKPLNPGKKYKLASVKDRIRTNKNHAAKNRAVIGRAAIAARKQKQTVAVKKISAKNNKAVGSIEKKSAKYKSQSAKKGRKAGSLKSVA